MKLSIPHRFRFGRTYDLRQQSDWDELRLADSGPFALPGDPAVWQQLWQAPSAVARARSLHALLQDARVIASYGAGTAATERALHELDPSRRLVLTEFAPRTAALLAHLFPESHVTQHDLRTDDPIAGIDVHLFLRIDTELEDAEFRATLERFRRERILLVATELLGVRAAAREALTWVRGGAVRAGRVRNRAAFASLFERTHESRRVSVDDLSGWFLEPKYGLRVG